MKGTAICFQVCLLTRPMSATTAHPRTVHPQCRPCKPNDIIARSNEPDNAHLIQPFLMVAQAVKNGCAIRDQTVLETQGNAYTSCIHDGQVHDYTSFSLLAVPPRRPRTPCAILLRIHYQPSHSTTTSSIFTWRTTCTFTCHGLSHLYILYMTKLPHSIICSDEIQYLLIKTKGVPHLHPTSHPPRGKICTPHCNTYSKQRFANSYSRRHQCYLALLPPLPDGGG